MITRQRLHPRTMNEHGRLMMCAHSLVVVNLYCTVAMQQHDNLRERSTQGYAVHPRCRSASLTCTAIFIAAIRVFKLQCATAPRRVTSLATSDTC